MVSPNLPKRKRKFLKNFCPSKAGKSKKFRHTLIFTHFRGLGRNPSKHLVCFLWDLTIPKFHSEIIWPLVWHAVLWADFIIYVLEKTWNTSNIKPKSSLQNCVDKVGNTQKLILLEGLNMTEKPISGFFTAHNLK